MFGLFDSPPFSDPHLGTLRRERGLWRGRVLLDGAHVPVALTGSRTAPDPQALDAARAISTNYSAWRPTIERALFEHYSPYAEAVDAGEIEPAQDDFPRLSAPAEVWPHTAIEFVQVTPLDGALAVEIGYRVAWDEEHTLGARFRAGEFLELCGSVLAP